MKWFHAWDTMDWPRISVIVAFATAFWIGLAALIPEKYHKAGTIILGSLSSAVTLMMRSGKSRAEKIEDKIEEHQADAVKKTEEIQELISNEAQEKAEKLEEKK